MFALMLAVATAGPVYLHCTSERQYIVTAKAWSTPRSSDWKLDFLDERLYNLADDSPWKLNITKSTGETIEANQTFSANHGVSISLNRITGRMNVWLDGTTWVQTCSRSQPLF